MMADPIAGIPFGWLLLAVGVLELVIAGVCFCSRNERLAALLVAWLATNFLVYRLCLWWMGWHRPCGCMGSLTSALHLSEKAADNVMKVVLACLRVGNVLPVFWQRSRCAFRRGSLWAAWSGVLAAMFVPACAGQEQASEGAFRCSGEERVFVQVGNSNVLVQSCTFQVMLAGTNWAIITEFPQVGMRQFNAFVAGSAYGATDDGSGTNISGSVLGSASAMLEGATEACRMLFLAFLSTNLETTCGLERPPVPFLGPRHPCLRGYVWNTKRLDNPPFFPQSVEFTLDPEYEQHASSDSIDYYYRRADNPRKEFKQFLAEETNRAIYETTQTTNIAGKQFPLRATLRHVYHERGASVKRVFEIRVAEIEAAGPADLRPQLSSGSSVQHVVNGTTYMYVSTNGQWLSADDARRVGMAARPRTTGKPLESRAARARGPRFLIIVLSVVPVGYWLWRMRTNETANTGKRKESIT